MHRMRLCISKELGNRRSGRRVESCYMGLGWIVNDDLMLLGDNLNIIVEETLAEFFLFNTIQFNFGKG